VAGSFVGGLTDYARGAGSAVRAACPFVAGGALVAFGELDGALLESVGLVAWLAAASALASSSVCAFLNSFTPRPKSRITFGS
jgi:hypothetical protein